jgi:hypothetical protein
MSDADDVAAMFHRAGSEIAGEVRKTVFKGALNVKKTAVGLAPKHLHTDDITFEIEDSGDEIAAVIETRGKGGAIFEFGTPSLPGGRPFLLPALEPEGDNLEKYVSEIVAGLFR